jgi:hemolysin III
MFNSRKMYPVPPPLPFQTPGEEIANAVIHGTGVLLAAAGLVLLALKAGGRWGPAGGAGGVSTGALAAVSYTIFSASMIAMFLSSTLYHGIQHEGAKRVLRIIDHSAIYLLIAGTYTPFSLLAFRGALGWVYFGIEWGLAAAGISLYSANVKFVRKAELAVYMLMGWALLAGIVRLMRSMPLLSVIFLFAGGAAYMLGIFWYIRHIRRGSHVTWHAFVLAGAVCHWFSIWFMR